MDWLKHVDWERVVLIASLGGNGILVFFNKALNEIVSHWYKERVKRKDRQQELLRALNVHLVAMERDHFLLLSGLRMQHAPDEETRALGKQTADERMISLNNTNTFLDRQ